MVTSLTRRTTPLDFIQRWFDQDNWGGGLALSESPLRVDIENKEKEFVVHAEMPGVPKEDIDVHVDGHVLSISGSFSPEQKQEKDEHCLYSERYSGKFTRSFALPQEVDEEKIVARYTDGVLNLHLPKKAVSSARRIPIH